MEKGRDRRFHSDHEPFGSRKYVETFSGRIPRENKFPLMSKIHSSLGSEREFDEVPNWRGFQDFRSPTELGVFWRLRPAGSQSCGVVSKLKA
jgi:hypothetical protein